MWEDLRTARVVKDLTRVAVVADRGWIESPGSVAGTLLPAEVRSFHPPPARRRRRVVVLLIASYF